MQFLSKPFLSFVMVSILGLRQEIPIMTPIIYGSFENEARDTRNAIWGVAVIVAFVVYLQFDAAGCYGCNFFYIQILLIFR